MNDQRLKIEKYAPNDREQMLKVWEKSVLATHDFLRSMDFEEIKKIVQTIDFTEFEVYCVKQNDVVAGFIGVAERKIEMLFIAPEYIGKGLGKQLIDFAISNFNVDKVDVNEQNRNAIKFYEKLGFRTYERTDKDDIGMNYPLLRMKLERNEN